MLPGQIGDTHFEGGANLQAQGGTKPHLAQFIAALQSDLVSVIGIKGVQEITVASPVAVAAADQSNLATGLTLAAGLKTTYNAIVILANYVKAALSPVPGIDIQEVDALEVELAAPVDQATLNAFLNDLKAKYNAAVPLLNGIKADLNTEGTVAIAATNAAVTAVADATDLATSQALANDLKAKINAAVTLINEVKTDLNAADKIALKSLALLG